MNLCMKYKINDEANPKFHLVTIKLCIRIIKLLPLTATSTTKPTNSNNGQSDIPAHHMADGSTRKSINKFYFYEQ